MLYHFSILLLCCSNVVFFVDLANEIFATLIQSISVLNIVLLQLTRVV